MKHALSILLYLYDDGNERKRVPKTALYEGVSYSGTMRAKLEFLKNEGLIVMNRAFLNTIYVELTERGNDLAAHLNEIEKALSNTAVTVTSGEQKKNEGP